MGTWTYFGLEKSPRLWSTIKETRSSTFTTKQSRDACITNQSWKHIHDPIRSRLAARLLPGVDAVPGFGEVGEWWCCCCCRLEVFGEVAAIIMTPAPKMSSDLPPAPPPPFPLARFRLRFNLLISSPKTSPVRRAEIKSSNSPAFLGFSHSSSPTNYRWQIWIHWLTLG